MGVKKPDAFDWSRAQIAHRDNLPHVRQENVVYFVTFRLGDSLPAERLAELKEQREKWIKRNRLPHTPQQKEEYRRIWTARIERLLDAGYGSCVLRSAECRGMLENIMRHADAARYQLGDFVIMPNHVHAMVHLPVGEELAKIIKARKSVSARQFGKRLGRAGCYWMDEYFDHALRSDESREKFVQYIRKNPSHLHDGEFTLGCGTLKL